ncbi:unnamed protein product [Ilex paraguariensis]|uniref:WW domain-containing protein n=1 Tax=Ilex paraguariensis TaxID=185542 RepID=A0ABC8SI50_9AQUA
MVSFHTPSLPSRRKIIQGLEDSMKKRKREEGDDSKAEEVFEKPQNPKSMKYIFNTEINLETPLPLEWQRCLDIKSGLIYYYNTTTLKRTSRDPRASPEPPSPGHMSLDLELNLPCGSVEKNPIPNKNFNRNFGSNSHSNISGDQFLTSSRNNQNSGGFPSWLTFDQGDHQEMVTAVCKNCHMLVIMCKSSPSCPNCKFVHPPDHSPPNLFKKRLSLLHEGLPNV